MGRERGMRENLVKRGKVILKEGKQGNENRDGRGKIRDRDAWDYYMLGGGIAGVKHEAPRGKSQGRKRGHRRGRTEGEVRRRWKCGWGRQGG